MKHIFINKKKSNISNKSNNIVYSGSNSQTILEKSRLHSPSNSDDSLKNYVKH